MFLHSRWLAVRASAEMEHDERCLRQVERNYAAGETPAINLPSQLVRHPLHDDWLDQRLILNKVDRIAVPVLSMEAFQDEATTARAGYYQERLDPDRLWYVQTNGNHDLYESLQFRPILLDFLDHFVKGLDNGFETRPHVEVWQETASTQGATGHARDEQARAGWLIQRQRFPIAVDLRTLTLNAGHALTFDAPAVAEHPATAAGRDNAGYDQYEYPIPGPSADLDADAPAWGLLQANWQQGSVAYTTAPLDSGFVIYGPMSADLWVSSTSSDTDLQITLTEVRPDGQERYVQRGWLRMSNRSLDPQHSTATRPWPCDLPSCIQALSPDAPAYGRVELTKVSYAFRAGSRLRIWIDTPSATGENSFDHTSLPSTNRVWHDAKHISTLVFGVIQGATIPSAAAPCGRVTMQPCRPDPFTQQ